MLSYSVVVPAISAVLVGLMALYVLAIRKSVSRSEVSNANMVDSLSKEVQGISHGSMGVGRKVLALEKEIEDLHIRLDEFQKNDPSLVSYSEAARLVEMGANVDDLMNSCGISRPEAELVTALTHSQKSNELEELVPTLTPSRHH